MLFGLLYCGHDITVYRVARQATIELKRNEIQYETDLPASSTFLFPVEFIHLIITVDRQRTCNGPATDRQRNGNETERQLREERITRAPEPYLLTV